MAASLMTNNMASHEHASEIQRGERFEFGKNWTSFLQVLDDDRIVRAADSLKQMLGVDDLEQRSFLDIGSGSGLFSLAARRLGARVHSFDYDPDSVACTQELRRRYFPQDARWVVEQGSALNADYVAALGKFDIVYSWGVLHHTGDMWRGLENAGSAVADNGILFVAIYNDTGSQARRWQWVKKTYCKLPKPIKPVFAAITVSPEEAKKAVSYTLSGKPWGYIRSWKDYRNERGMNRWNDIIDWVGGYPYEVATADQIFDFFKARNFKLERLKTGGVGLGCNEFVFRK